MSGWRRWCQGRRTGFSSSFPLSLLRDARENVTCGWSFAASDGPIPLTRSSPLTEPNGPRAARSATIRLASAGPIPGSRSSSATPATSRFTGARTGASIFAEGGGSRVDGLRAPATVTAESTAAIWAASADRSIADGAASPIERQPRTPTPRAATAATKRRA